MASALCARLPSFASRLLRRVASSCSSTAGACSGALQPYYFTKGCSQTFSTRQRTAFVFLIFSPQATFFITVRVQQYIDTKTDNVLVVYRDLNPDVLKRWFERKVRFSSAELPMSFMDKTGPFQPLLEPVVQKLLGTVVDMKVRRHDRGGNIEAKQQICVQMPVQCVCVCVLSHSDVHASGTGTKGNRLRHMSLKLSSEAQ